MRLVHAIRRWRKLNRGRGRAMRDAGAVVRPCPHCNNGTPLYRSEYGADRQPLSFTACLWCEGLVEYDGAAPRLPYATEHDEWTAVTRETPPVRVDDLRGWLARRSPTIDAPPAMSQLFLENLHAGR